MKSVFESIRRSIPLIFFLGMFQIAGAHPGAPGHYHPDEVDEFDQVSHAAGTVESERDFDLGGALVLIGVVGCLGFAFTQKQGGIWSDVTSNH